MTFTFEEQAFPELPAEVSQVIATSLCTEFGSLTAKGVPLDTPLFAFVGPSGRTLDVATGLSYPTKAERVRRNPKVGLLLEGNGSPDQPVVSIAGFGAVRDTDIQANLERYIAETLPQIPTTAGNLPWSTVRQAVWYLARIIVQTTPQCVLWWPNGAHTDEPPQRWEAPPSTSYPASDPAPEGPPTPPASWGLRGEWRARAARVVERGVPGHLTVCDGAGFPLPFRLRSVAVTTDGFALDIPAGAPWRAVGSASLCFNGRLTFIGQVEGDQFTVERMLPDHPLMADPKEIWDPTPETRAALMGRLTRELQRRNLPLPVVPEEMPQATPGALLRAGTGPDHPVAL
jgi:hypothetical protein